MALPEILQLKKVPSSRILTPPPAAKGYFNKEVNEMTAEFLRRMNKHKEDIIRNYEDFQVYLKKTKINYKKLSGAEKLALKKRLGITDASMNTVNDMGRMFASLETTNPDFAKKGLKSFADAVSDSLDEVDPSKARKAFRAWQIQLEKLADKGKFLVGHHSSPLKGIWNSVKNAPEHLKKPMMTALEELYGLKLGEGSLVDMLQIAHMEKSQTQLGGAWIEALDGVKNLDDYNPNIRPKILNKLAHAGRFGGTTQYKWMPPEDLLKNITNAEEGATLLRPYLDAAKAMSDQGLETSNAIAKVLFKGGKISPENIIPAALKKGGAVEQAIEAVPEFGIKKADEILGEWSELLGKSAYRYSNWRQPGLYSGLPLGTVQDHIETAKDVIGRTPKGRLVRGAAVVGGALPILGIGVDAAVAGTAWHTAKNNPSIKNIGAAVGETMILADQVTPFGAVGQIGNQIVRQYTDPERGPGKIRGRSGAKRAIEAKKLEQKQLQARFIPSKEQEDWWSQSFTSKPWLTR
tara:strand:- start:311 stop:1870 length:1560 start_codon:yes stop_codon:yes gene_type:complete